MSGTSGSVAATTADDEYEVLCDDTGSFLRRYSTEGGATVVTDTELDGTTPYAPSGTVTLCGPQTQASLQIASTAQRQIGAGSVAVTAGARSVTLMVFAGTAGLAIGGGAVTEFPLGATATWSVDRGGQAGEQLADEFIFTGVAGSDFMILSTREA